MSVRGVLQVHCAPPALCPHIEWAVAGVLGVPVSMPWVDQPASPGSMRAELLWHGKPGAGGAITSALASWNLIRFEVTEDASPGCDAVRYSDTPSLGTFCGGRRRERRRHDPGEPAARSDGARRLGEDR